MWFQCAITILTVVAVRNDKEIKVFVYVGDRVPITTRHVFKMPNLSNPDNDRESYEI